MATKYSLRWCWEGKESESIALLSDAVRPEVLTDMVDCVWANHAVYDNGEESGLRWVDCIDMDTGEVIAERSNWDELDPDWGYNEDCGFDPYVGCYTDDC